MKSQKEFEDIINNSSLFKMQGDEDDYDTIKYQLLDILAKYYEKYIYPDKTWMIAGEFMDTYCSCVKSYKQEYGEFLPYFDTSFRKNY